LLLKKYLQDFINLTIRLEIFSLHSNYFRPQCKQSISIIRIENTVSVYFINTFYRSTNKIFYAKFSVIYFNVILLLPVSDYLLWWTLVLWFEPYGGNICSSSISGLVCRNTLWRDFCTALIQCLVNQKYLLNNNNENDKVFKNKESQIVSNTFISQFVGKTSKHIFGRFLQ